MDWIAALLGVVIGAAGTYLIQSSLQKRQRDWDLDDQKRQWKRERLKRLSDQLSDVMAVLHKMFTEAKNKDSSVRELEKYKNDYLDKAAKLSADVDATFDDELHKLWWNDFMKSIRSADLKSLQSSYEEVDKAHRRVQRRINTLYDESFL